MLPHLALDVLGCISTLFALRACLNDTTDSDQVHSILLNKSLFFVVVFFGVFFGGVGWGPDVLMF